MNRYGGVDRDCDKERYSDRSAERAERSERARRSKDRPFQMGIESVVRVRSRIRTPGDLWLGGRMLLWACCLPVLKHLIALPALVRFVGRPSTRSGGSATNASRVEELDRIATLARWSCRVTRWSSGGNCLERGLVLYRFLGAADFQPSLFAGFRKGEGGDVHGHAWVVLDGRPVGENSASVEEFEPVIAFGPDCHEIVTGQPLGH
jgi:hypothetical protein